MLAILNFQCYWIANIRFSNILTIPLVREKNKEKLALAVPIDAPTILVNEIIDAPPLAALKTIKVWSI